MAELSWAQLTTADAAGARAFYTPLFDWSFVGDAAAARVQLRGRDVAGLYQAPIGQAHWTSYVTVESAEATAQRARELGGTLLSDPGDVPGSGRLAVVRDPTGAVLSLWEPRGPALPFRDVPGAVCRHELITRDLRAAEEFYSALFGWRAVPHVNGWHTSWYQGDRLIGGMLAMDDGWGLPACWLPVFAVSHCEAGVEMASVLGGRVLMDTRLIPELYGTLAILRDGQGAPFAILQPFDVEREREIERRIEDPQLSAEEIEAWIQDLVLRLQHSRRDAQAKVRWADLLGKLGRRLAELGRVSPAAFAALAELLEDHSAYDYGGYYGPEWVVVSHHAYGALVEIGPLALPVFARALESADPDTCESAAFALVALRRRGAPAVDVLLRALDSPADKARRHAARALGEIGPPARAAATVLEERAALDPSAPVRGAAAHALAAVLQGDPERRSHAARMLEAPSTRLAGLLVARGLSHEDRATLADQLAALLSDADPVVRLGAAEQLEVPPDDPTRGGLVVDRLIELLSEEDPAIRVRAARRLSRLPEPDGRVVGALIAFFEDEYSREMARTEGRNLRSESYRSSLDALEKVGRRDPRVAAALLGAASRQWPGDPARARAHWYRSAALDLLA
jgi:uncharacterized protein